VWAEYGTYVSAEYRERLAVMSAQSVTRRHVAEEGQGRWPLAISSFTQVREIVEGAPGLPKRHRAPAPRRARPAGKGKR
jgi:phosphoglycolate phosphatase